MKTNPYVAVHCCKALSLRIVCCPLKIIFIKGPVSKLHLNFTSLTALLSLKVLNFSQVQHAAYLHLCTTICSHLNLTEILPCKNLSKAGAHSQKWPGANFLNILPRKTDAQPKICKLMMRTYNFQMPLHGIVNTWMKSSTFKGKCAVNTVNSICNLLTGPLMKIIFEGRRTKLKARAFQICIAT